MLRNLTELEVHVYLEHLEWRNRGGGPDLSMDGCVPPETQKCWEGKVAAARFNMPEMQAKLAEAQARSERAARDVAKMRKATALKAEYERQKAEQKGGTTN